MTCSAHIKNQIFELRGYGLHQNEIAKRLGVSQQVISYQLKQMRLAYFEMQEELEEEAKEMIE